MRLTITGGFVPDLKIRGEEIKDTTVMLRSE